MRYSPPMNPLSAELAAFTIRVYDLLRKQGVRVKMHCSRTNAGAFEASRSKYLEINGGATRIRISDHRLPRNSPNQEGRAKIDLELIINSLRSAASEEQRAKQWIEQNYGSPQIQALAS